MEVMTNFLQWLTPVIFGVFTFIINHKIDKNDKKAESRAELRRKESFYQVELLLSNTNLTHTIGDCMKKGKFNGELTQAVLKCRESEEKYRKFLKETAIKKLEE